ncbi:MAG: BlaI/MecI/CopY family transcriptional regulator [Bacteroidetes bacterium]|jgi:BlaI family transcriptional regulator, penicillinase repressor|nr:MAG: BlaI/MecI/CopY family transcriptional regulator [Bacteroidota bacterium]
MRNHIPKPTEGELEILAVLWRHGASTVRFVNEQMGGERPVGYTTTLKLMQIMFEKGLLHRTLTGKTHVYAAALSEQDTRQQLLDRLVDTAFEGSAMRLVMQALGRSRSTPEELDEIRRFLDQLSDSTSNEPKS